MNWSKLLILPKFASKKDLPRIGIERRSPHMAVCNANH